MKKYAISIIVTIISVGVYFYMNPSPKKVIETHLKNKYKEEFVVELLGKRDKTYEAIVYPQKYVGTSKENDSYYWGRGFAKGRNGGDTYGLVLLNESTNEFFLPKLKELFGENVLPIFNMGPGYIKNNFKDEIELMKKAYKKYPTANFEPISGGIYIFGRVENDEDREWYRKQIYEFVQFMKQTGTFEYVELDIMIVDERVLTKEFRENLLQIQNKLAKNPKTRADIEKRKERRIIMSELNNYFNKETDYSEVLNSYIKSDVLERGSSAMAKNSSLLYLRLYSPKLIISKGWNESGNPELYEEIKNYDNIQDVKFEWEAW